MKKMNQILAAALLACMAACTSNQKKETATTEPTATEAAAAADDTTALAMTGTFEGIFPAASCEGIRASLTINADSTYTYKREYIGEKDLIELITPSSGEKTYFKHVETGFMLSDSLGTVNQGELAGHYILKRQ